MNDIVLEIQTKQGELNARTRELYNRLTEAGNDAADLINKLNKQKIRIFIANIKLFIAKIRKVF